ncbi:hypothetical protein ASE64_11255 [Agreia sp. Leaf210]|nr:hypothetical protein ASE64_11255 [Agreia sp. Leaf210]
MGTFDAVQTGTRARLDQWTDAHFGITEHNGEMGDVTPEPGAGLTRVGTEGRHDDGQVGGAAVVDEGGAQTCEYRADCGRADGRTGDDDVRALETAARDVATAQCRTNSRQEVFDVFGGRADGLADHVEAGRADAFAQHGDQVLLGDRDVVQGHDRPVGSDLQARRCAPEDGITGIYLQNHAQMMPDRRRAPPKLCTADRRAAD